jgi:uncharacterized lipoprotein YajG
MANATKTFKIGEYAMGGIIQVKVTGKIIQVFVKDYYTNETLRTGTTSTEDEGVERKLSDFLNDVTTSYYADKVMKWIKEKTGLKFMWC